MSDAKNFFVLNLNTWNYFPLAADPLDAKYVYVKNSEAVPGGGESLYAKQDIPAGTVVSILSGFVMPNAEIEELGDKQKNDCDARGLPKYHEDRFKTWAYR